MTRDVGDGSTATWRVTPAMQADFVVMSGDSNPIHTDALAARRLPFGRTAVHGMHLVLDALERLVDGVAPRRPTHVTATFRHPVGVDDEIRTAWHVDDDTVRVTVEAASARVADITVALGELTSHEMPYAHPSDEAPERLDADDLLHRSGAISVAADASALADRFPTLTATIGHTTPAELLSLTRLVGMHVPGLHSLFSSLDVALSGGSGNDGLAYEVTRYDDRFAQVTIAVDGPNVRGSLRAFLRPEPVEPTIGDTRPGAGEFAGHRWLVVGGSRGLGAITTLLLDAGGADVRCTYRTGADDADRLVGRTTHVAALHLDVGDPSLGLAELRAAGWRPTHLAYFASPPIFVGSHGAWSDTLERVFRDIYIDGAARLIAEFDDLEGLLWPSSEAVETDTPGLAEYAAVKRDGETWCRRLADQGVRTHAPRLPRLRTDQTASFVPVEYGDAPAEILAALRATVHDA